MTNADGLTSSSFNDGGSPSSSSENQVHGGNWSDDDIESLLLTLVAFAFLTFAAYYFVIRPILSGVDGGGGGGLHQQAGRRQQADGSGRVGPPGQHQQRRGDLNSGPGLEEDLSDGGVGALLSSSTRRPPHLSSSSNGGAGGSGVLVDGLVPFRQTHASSYESSLATTSEENLVMSNRRERARLFTRLLSPSLSGGGGGIGGGGSVSSPPARGGNVVVTIPEEDVGCEKLRRVLFLLGTYYNLFVVLTIDDSGKTEKEENEVVSRLQRRLRHSGEDKDETEEAALPQEVLPTHRIMACSAIVGRVAFVRQLARVEFVLDYDPEVRNQLGRFGFRVLIYGDGTSAGGSRKKDDEGATMGQSSSMLGRALLP